MIFLFYIFFHTQITYQIIATSKTLFIHCVNKDSAQLSNININIDIYIYTYMYKKAYALSFLVFALYYVYIIDL